MALCGLQAFESLVLVLVLDLGLVLVLVFCQSLLTIVNILGRPLSLVFLPPVERGVVSCGRFLHFLNLKFSSSVGISLPEVAHDKSTPCKL